MNGKFPYIVLMSGLLAAVIWRFLSIGDLEGGHVSFFRGNVKIRGCVDDEVDVRVDKVKYIIETEEIFFEGKWRETFGRVLINGSRYPVYEYGDCFVITGNLEKPGKIDDFDYGKYLERYHIYAIVNFADMAKYSNGDNVFWNNLYRLKQWSLNRLGKIYGEPEASFMAGILLGSRKGIPQDLLENFNRVGLTHIIAVSGYNITLVVAFVGCLFGFLRKKMRAVFAAVFVVVFVLFVGASAAVVRAGVMGMIGLAALYFGRLYYAKIALFAAAVLMILWNPLVFLYDVGFQLSFLATAGLIWASPILEKYFMWLPEKFGIRNALALTLSAQIFALPIMVWNFGYLSLISPLANVFVLPFIPISMVFGFISLFFGKIVGLFGYFVLKIVIMIVNFFAGFGFAVVETKWHGKWWAIPYYLLVLLWLSGVGRRGPRSRK
ncbi:ComEC/Rec2 family competence protein [Candidatus Peregrinibacteria bacterium]|nr:ComEC/Rec2 family competence protein [Candidatus Peregrinibacteria bacterium]